MRLFKNARLIFPDKVRSLSLLEDGGNILEIGQRFDESGVEVIDCGGLYLSPGFIDLHTHGGGGFSAMSGSEADVISMCKAHSYYGTTSILPTTLTAPAKKIVNAVLAISKAKQKCKDVNILGVHMEGPYISYEMRGAQSPNDIITPLDLPAENFFDICDDIVIMGAAPEIEGGLSLGTELSKRGIVASVAHSNARFSLVEDALNYGYSDITHIFSACSTITRENLLRVGGVVEAGLALDGYTAQFIADLRHLPTELIRLIYKCKGGDGAYAITDGLEYSASDIKEGQTYVQENGLEVVYDDGVMKLSDFSSLAGSAANSAMMLKNLYIHSHIPLYDAVRMLTLTPASVIGMGKQKGKLQAGYDADLVLFDDDISIKMVMVNGKIIRNEIN